MFLADERSAGLTLLGVARIRESEVRFVQCEAGSESLSRVRLTLLGAARIGDVGLAAAAGVCLECVRGYGVYNGVR
jgi:hypothetical protein